MENEATTTVQIDLDPDTHRALRRIARKEQCSLDRLIILFLEESVSRVCPDKRIARKHRTTPLEHEQ